MKPALQPIAFEAAPRCQAAIRWQPSERRAARAGRHREQRGTDALRLQLERRGTERPPKHPHLKLAAKCSLNFATLGATTNWQ